MTNMTDHYTWPDMHLRQKISPSVKLSFLTAFILGVITHLYLFTNLLLNHDSIIGLVTENEHTVLGRWALRYLSELSTDYQLPVVIGILSILALAITSVLTVRILNLSHPVSIILVSGFIVTSPIAAAIFSYLFTVDAYFIALSFNAVGVYLTKKYRWGWIASIVLLAVACGTYQAFIGYAIGLFLFDCIMSLLSENSVQETIKQGVKYILIILFSLISYYVILKLILSVRGMSLGAYQGIDQFNVFDIRGFLSCIPSAYGIFRLYLWNTPYLPAQFLFVQRIICLLFPILFTFLLISKKVYREPLRLLLAILGVLLIPLALDFIAILSVHSTVHELMVYSFILFFIFTVKLAEMSAQEILSLHLKHWLFPFALNTLLCSILIWGNFCISNIIYLRMQICYENTFAVTNRIVARMEALDEYSLDTPVVILGGLKESSYGKADLFRKFDDFGGTAMTILNDPRIFITDYLGTPLAHASPEQREEILSSGIIDSMPCYPENGYIQVHSGVIIVKLSDGGIAW